jgi:competence protein ComEC
MMYYFQRLSLISIIANPLILPVQPLLMILGGIATLIGMLWIPLARPIAALAWPFPAFTIHAVAALSNWPYVSVGISHIGFGTVFVFYAALGLVTWILLTPPGKRNFAAIAQRIKSHIRIPAITVLVVLMILTGLTWADVMRQPDGILHITILDVGGGEAVLIQTPHGQNVLINGGPSSIRLSDALGRQLSVSNRSVDVLMLTHDDPVHIGALQGIAEQYIFDLTLVSGEFQGTTYKKLAEKLQNPDTAFVHVEAGHRLSFGEDASLEVLAVGDRGAVILVRYGRARIVLAPGAGPDLTSALAGDESIKKVNAVLLSDGGNPAANPPQWLSDLDPDLVLLSTNSEQLPSADLLRQLMGRTILRTDIHGSIELVTDGGRLWVQVERNPADFPEVIEQERAQPTSEDF